MFRIGVVVFFFLFLSGCLGGYETANCDPPQISEPYTLDYEKYEFSKETSFAFEYVQVSGISDETLMEQINTELYKASTEWINETCTWINGCTPNIYCADPNYLSVGYSFQLGGDMEKDYDGWQVRIYITRDMTTGTRVRLNDLEDDLESLAQQIKTYKYDTEFSSPITEELCNRIISDASLTELEFINEKSTSDTYATENITGYLLDKPSFYFADDELIIKRDRFEYSDIIIKRTRGTITPCFSESIPLQSIEAV